MTTHSTIYIDNDSVLKVESLRDRDGNLVSNATVTIESLTDRSGNAVSGVSTPSAFTNVGSGNYELQIPSTAGFVNGRLYLATVKALTVGGLVAEWTETVIAKRRSA